MAKHRGRGGATSKRVLHASGWEVMRVLVPGFSLTVRVRDRIARSSGDGRLLRWQLRFVKHVTLGC